MAKRKNNSSLPVVFMALSVLSLIFAGVVVWVATKQADVIGKYELLEMIDNQACRYLDKQVGVNGSFDLDVNAPKGKPKLVYECLTGQVVKTKDMSGKFIDNYKFGVSVSYFSSNQEAKKFAEDKLNPLRYWHVDETGKNKGVPEYSRFIYEVNDEKVYYVDAYAVKANAVLRLSLPCSPESCEGKALNMFDRELKGINLL